MLHPPQSAVAETFRTDATRLIGESPVETQALRRLGPHACSPRWTRYAQLAVRRCRPGAQPQQHAYGTPQGRPPRPAGAGSSCRPTHMAGRHRYAGWPPLLCSVCAELRSPNTPAPWAAHRGKVMCPAAHIIPLGHLGPHRSSLARWGGRSAGWHGACLSHRPSCGGRPMHAG
jgi:hypothetical protein